MPQQIAQLDQKAPIVMGIINTTPDSFSDGGQCFDLEHAVAHARRLIDEGADILDIGGESTRPGAAAVSKQEEVSRTVPLIERIRQFSDIPLSIDTSKPSVMQAAADAGVSMINDVRALREDGALLSAAKTGLPVCLMHMQGEPRTMQDEPEYSNVLFDVKRFLHQRIDAALAAGIEPHNIIVDPGFGFGKTLEHNLQLLNALPDLRELGFPLLVGLSRKSMIGAITGQPVDKRLYGSLAAAVISAMLGADIVRVHDVDATRQALAMVKALKTMPETME
jgi:dihydropteroate synthase